jgi:ribA/ribD-fused uncharacterized protein
MAIYQFYSKSADCDDFQLGLPGWRKMLSNFAVVPEGITVKGRRFPTVEHAFQGAKFEYTNRPDLVELFTCEGSIKTAANAKKAGGRKGMSKEYTALQIDKWALNCDQVMKDALKARFEVDPDFRRILGAVADSGATLLHYEGRGGKYWGGRVKNGEIVGLNKLGKMMMALP